MGTNAPDAPQRENALPVFRVSVRRVVIDVAVTDASGKPVQGLSRDSFQVLEDGIPQPIRSFEAHVPESGPSPELPKLPPDTYSDFASAPAGSPVTVILLDLLNTPFDRQPYERAQMLDFLKHRKQSGQVAIFVLTDQLHLLQGFTEDDDALIAALASQTSDRSGLMSRPQEAHVAGDQIVRTDGNLSGPAAHTDPSSQAIAGMQRNMRTIEASYQLDQRVDITVSALQQIARFLAGSSGRKDLLWVSAGFPTGVFPNDNVNGRDPATGRNEFSATRNYSQQVKAASTLLESSRVAVYPIDARGLEAAPMFSAASSGSFGRGPRLEHHTVREFEEQLGFEHATMDSIAEATGGRAFYNTNGLSAAAAAVESASSSYYTITYTPSSKSGSGKLHRIAVKVTPASYTLTYRRSYFSADSKLLEHASGGSSPDALANTLQHGAPQAHQVFFEAHLAPAGVPMSASPQQIANLDKYEGMEADKKQRAAHKIAPPIMLQGYVIEYALLPQQLELQLGPDGARRDDLEFASISYDQDGRALDGTRTEIHDVIKPDRWSLIEAGGYHIPTAILVPLQARWLRLVVRDVVDGHLGSLELQIDPPAADKMEH